MHSDVLREIKGSRLFAMDATPAGIIKGFMRRLTHNWQAYFKDASDTMATAFAQQALNHSDVGMQHALRKAGFSVRFQQTPAMRDEFDSVKRANVDLIKSIPAQYLDEVEALVSESVNKGRSMKAVTARLGELVRLNRKPNESDASLLARTKRRASFIARDQNNKATATMNRIRRHEIGIEKCIWRHTLASVHPRESHEGLDGTPFDSEEGAWDWEEQDYVQPGWLPNCGCIASAVIPGLESEFPETEGIL
jgi:uncharacterized protein with gpF-like domain